MASAVPALRPRDHASAVADRAPCAASRLRAPEALLVERERLRLALLPPLELGLSLLGELARPLGVLERRSPRFEVSASSASSPASSPPRSTSMQVSVRTTSLTSKRSATTSSCVMMSSFDTQKVAARSTQCKTAVRDRRRARPR
jgi:hypothetical protein